MKKAGRKINFVKNKVITFGKEISLQFISSGHYAIPLNVYHKDLKLSRDKSKFTEVSLKRNLIKKNNKQV